MTRAVIVQGFRTPIGKIGGQLRDIEPHQLTAFLLRHAVRTAELPMGQVNDVIVGNVVGPGGNLARLSLLEAGFPVEVPGVTVDRQCGSGLEAVTLACRMVQAGAGDFYLAGGVESSSRAPWKMEKPRRLHSLEVPQVYGRARFSPDEIGDPEMGEAAENVAERYQVSREAQDAYALESHRKAVRAIEDDRWQGIMVPVPTPEPREPDLVCSRDECPRANTSIERLAALKPIFRAGGTVTAGNACPVNDGAAMLTVMSEERSRQLGLKPLLRFVDTTVAGVNPNYLGIGPVPAVEQLLKRNRLRLDEIGLVEFNEAFASQVLASLRELGIPEEKVNVNGGALAYGHPYGASGAILVVHLAAEMARRDVRYGLVTLGVGGGMGMAALFEKGEE